MKSDVVLQNPISSGTVAMNALYALTYTAALLLLSLFIFSRREFK